MGWLAPPWLGMLLTTNSTTIRRTLFRNSAMVIVAPGTSAFLTSGCLLNASKAGPVAAHTKSGPRMPSRQKVAKWVVMFSRISFRTFVSHPTGASAGRFLHTSQTDDDRAADWSDRVRLVI